MNARNGARPMRNTTCTEVTQRGANRFVAKGCHDLYFYVDVGCGTLQAARIYCYHRLSERVTV